MKYCPQCNKQFTEVWLSFCPDDGTPLVHELAPSQDPNWDPKIREPKVEAPSEQETQWLPRDPPMPGARRTAANEPRCVAASAGAISPTDQ